jgi:hypothetical protein
MELSCPLEVRREGSPNYAGDVVILIGKSTKIL